MPRLITNKLLSCLLPSEQLDPIQWVESNIEFSTSGEPYLLSKTPYWRDVLLDAFDLKIENIRILKSAQIGYSALLFGILMYRMINHTGDCMLILPTLENAREIYDNIINFINRNPKIAAHLVKASKGRIQFLRNSLWFASGNTSKTLKSRAICTLGFDEIEEMPLNVDGEGSPIELAEARAITYMGRGKKIILGSTPRRGGIMVPLFEGAAEQRFYHVPCVYCQHYQQLDFFNLKWDLPKSLSHQERARIIEAAPNLVYYECERCKGKIYEESKFKIVRDGVWLSHNHQTIEGGRILGTRPKVLSVAYKVNSVSSNMFPWNRLAANFLLSLSDPQKSAIFFSQYLGQNKDKQQETIISSGATVQKLKEQAVGRKARVIPRFAGALVLSADQQKDRVYFVVRCFGNSESQLVDYGVCSSFDELPLDRTYPMEAGGLGAISKAIIDMGGYYDGKGEDAKKKAFTYALAHLAPDGSPRVIPAKGVPTIRSQTYDVSHDPVYDNHVFLAINTTTMKDRLVQLQQENRWFVHEETDSNYFDSITSEKKILCDDGISRWQGASNNHFWDCEQQAITLAHYLKFDELPSIEQLERLRQPKNDLVSQLIKAMR